MTQIASERIRESVKKFYTEIASRGGGELCCPVNYDKNDTGHIPKEALEISCGCGSPVTVADIREGDTVLDLGSGGGIDCFIAAKKVGETGKVIGIDMLDEMLDRATAASAKVANNLGYHVVEFKKGLLEDIPIEDEDVDVVTSNCVINLSPDKEEVFKEIYRILKPNGRFCISDIVAEREVPASMKQDKKLWGECISGALCEGDFINSARKAGFYGLHIVKRFAYRKINGIKFSSITVNAYKFAKGQQCVYIGQYAIYNGPFKSVLDDDGHEYPLGIPVEICADTAEKLSRPPYQNLFTLLYSGKTEQDNQGCKPGCC